MRVIRLREPVVRGNGVVDFSWSVTQDNGFYREPRFALNFPASVDVDSVSDGVWLRVMMICLYTHWAVLRPCRVEIPRSLPAGEREFWLRMIDAAVWALENDQDVPGGPPFAERIERTVELVDFGPPAGELAARPGDDAHVASFSGGRDSLTQLAMLREIGISPLLVTTTSKREGSIEFETPRFRKVLGAVQERTGCELAEVRSDIRTSFMNNHPAVARYGLAASELTDTLLYFAVCWATACARGASHVHLASEAEAQESIRRDGTIVQIEHFGFSAATQRALSALIAPTGVTYGGLTSALEHFQIQRLLDRRYTDLRDLQYSCYLQGPGEEVCSSCFSCLKTTLHKISDDAAPSEIAIDVNKVLDARSDWTPSDDGESRSSVGQLYGDRMNNHLVRVLRELTAERVARYAPGGELSAAATDGLARLRATAFAAADPADDPGYRAEYLELLDEPMRSGLASIFAEIFEPEPVERYSHLLENTRILSGWIAAPLGASRFEAEAGVELGQGAGRGVS